MLSMRIILDAENMAEGKDIEKCVHLTNPITVGGLRGGMGSGKPSVAFMFDLPDGSTVIAETSLQLFVTAARAFINKYGDPTRTTGG